MTPRGNCSIPALSPALSLLHSPHPPAQPCVLPLDLMLCTPMSHCHHPGSSDVPWGPMAMGPGLSPGDVQPHRAASFSPIGRQVLSDAIHRIWDCRVAELNALRVCSFSLTILCFAFQHSYREVGILLLYLAVGVSVFSGVAYTAEKEEDVGFDTIPACWWWGTVSMTTVGYGDVVPVTVAGKLAASGCILGGILVVALPITIIFNKFSHFYRKQKALEAAVRNSEKKKPEEMESEQDSEALSESSLGRGSPDRRSLTPGALPAP